MRILLVEDDPVLGRSQVVSFELEGYQVSWARDLKGARAANENEKFNIVVLDLGLPDGNGLDFLKELRQAQSRLPVIVLTAKTDEDTVVEALQIGANDYVRKPFSQKELFARVKAVLREPSVRNEQIRFGDLLLLPENRQAMFGDKHIDLNRREFDILLYLTELADTVVTRDRLIEKMDGEMFDRTVDSHISHLRAKLKKAGLLTVKVSSVYGIGYRIEKVK